ncbi:MAG: PIG-L deacetylase family protein [Nanoarchaeota archaeon]
MKDAVMVIGAHSDDQIFGVGGTLSKYAQEGRDIYTVIFSFGEASHPLIKSKITAETRVRESQEADAFIGGKGVTFLGIKEAHFNKEIGSRKVVETLKKMIDEKGITTLFTHSNSDLHPHHRAVLRVVLDAVDGMENGCDVYSFDIWNPLKFRGRKNPRLVVDISKTYTKKIKALQLFKSQRLSYYILAPSVFISAIANGLAHGTRYAEVFLKVR